MSKLVEIVKSGASPLAPFPTKLTPHLPKFDNIQAIAFDIYGTLFISGSGDIGISTANQREEVLREILAEHFSFTPPTDKTLTGQLLKLIKEEHSSAQKEGITFPEVEIRDLWATLINRYSTFSGDQIEELALRYETAINPVWPMPNLSNTLAEIHTRGLKLGIVSNAQFYTPYLFPAFLDKSMEDLHFSADLCVYSYQEHQAKPGMFLYEKLRQKLSKRKISPENVLYVGNDMRNDIAPAKQLEFKTVLFAGDQRSLRLREEMNLPQPDATVTDLSQIIELLA